MAKRNCYRNLVIEFYARNSSSVLAITHKRWPEQPWSSQAELARIISKEVGWELDYRSLSRRLRTVFRTEAAVRDRIFELLSEPALYAPDFTWDAFCGRWNFSCHQKSLILQQI